MTNVDAVIKRYTTQQFRHQPVVSVAKLMGLHAYLPQIKQRKAEIYPILCGLIMYRGLDSAQKQDVVRSIVALPRDMLMSKLYGMVGDIVANPYWYCWDLNDEELRIFFKENADLAKVLSFLGGSPMPTISVTFVASVVYQCSKKGAAQFFRQSIAQAFTRESVSNALVDAGVGGVARSGGLIVGAGLLAMALVGAMAKSKADEARRELALRGLIRIDDL